MPNIIGPTASTGKVMLYNPSVIFVSNGDVGYNQGSAVINLNYRPITPPSTFPYKQKVEWYGTVNLSVSPYTQFGTEFFIGSTYSTSYQNAQFSGYQTGYPLYAGITYNLRIYAKSLGKVWSSGGINVVAKTRPADVASVTASSSGSNYVSASWAAVDAGGDSSVTYYWQLYRNGSFYASSSGTGLSTSFSGVPASSTYYYNVYTGNSVGTNFGSMITSNSVTTSAAASFGNVCTSLDRSIGNCPIIGCCAFFGSGSVCTPAFC